MNEKPFIRTRNTKPVCKELGGSTPTETLHNMIQGQRMSAKMRNSLRALATVIERG